MRKTISFVKLNYPVLICVFMPVLIFGRLILNGETLFWGTPLLQYIPWQSAMFTDVLDGTFPWWNPRNGLGAPLIANYQSAFFYPSTWVLFIFFLIGKVPGLASGNTVIICLHLMLAGIGMVCFVKTLGMSAKAQALAAMSFSLSGYMIARINFFPIILTLTWFPWILFSIEKLILSYQQKESDITVRISRILILTLFISLLFFAGHAQSAWYSIVFCVAWTIFRSGEFSLWNHKLKLFIHIACSFIVAILISAIQLVPTAEYLFNSQRSTSLDYDYAANYSLWPPKLLTLFLPNFFGSPAAGTTWGKGAYWEDASYIGIISILLAFYAIVLIFKKDRSVKVRRISIFLLIAIIISLIISFGKYTPIYRFLYQHVITFDLFQAPERMLIWTTTSLSILAAIGFDSVPPLRGWMRYSCRLLLAASAGIIITTVAVSFIFRDVKQVLLISILVFSISFGVSCGLFLLKKRIKNPGIWDSMIIGFLAIDLLVTWIPYPPGVSMDFWNKIGRTNVNEIEPRVFWSLEAEEKIKYSTFFNFSDFYAVSSWPDIYNFSLANLNILQNTPSFNNYDPFVPEKYSRMLETINSWDQEGQQKFLRLLNISHFIVLKEENREIIEQIPIQPGQYYHFYTCSIDTKDFEESLEILNASITQGESWDNVVVIENPAVSLAREDCNPTPEFRIFNVSMRSDFLSFDIQASELGYLQVADSNFPGWIARVDEEPTPIHYGNGFLKTVFIPQGLHHVEIQYRPTSYLAGLIGSVTGLSIVVILLVSIKLKTKRRIHEKFKITD